MFLTFANPRVTGPEPSKEEIKVHTDRSHSKQKRNRIAQGYVEQL